MLGLQLSTDPRWANLVQQNIDEILTDHAYCEQKAASSCISLITNYSEYTELVEKLAPVVTEEWGHFRQVLSELKKRGYKLGGQRKDSYVNELRTFACQGERKQDRLLDQLLMCALIEARSCERFRVLSQELAEAELRQFYHQFMIAEAGHYKLFMELARTYMPAELVESRWQEWLKFEANLLEQLELRGDRMH